MESNPSAISHYQTALSGMMYYYTKAKQLLETSCPDATVPSPVTLQLNTHNIVDVQKAILDTFRYEVEDNVCGIIRRSPFWSLMHDGITKFHTEYNGVCLHG